MAAEFCKCSAKLEILDQAPGILHPALASSESGGAARSTARTSTMQDLATTSEPDGVHDWETEIGTGVASLIVPGVFLGDRVVAAGPCAEFSAVLNITERCENYHEGRLQYLRIAVDDKETVDLATHFEEICTFIECHHGSGGVLVHCRNEPLWRSGASVQTC